MSSSSSNSNNPVDSHGNPPTIQDNRRRSSGHGPSTLFESLTNQKRKSSDAGATARRASYNEQGIKGNYFSKLWDEYTRGK